MRDRRGGHELAVRPRQDRPAGIASTPGAVPGREDVPRPLVVVVRSGASRADRRVGPGDDPLREPLLRCPRSAGRRARRPVPGNGSSSEVVPPESGQALGQPEDPPHVGQPPAVDRLVVVADEEDPVPGAASRSASPSCDRSTSWTSSTRSSRHAARQRVEKRGVGLERRQRPGDEVVEVEPTGRRERPLVGDERPGPSVRQPGRRRRRRADARCSSLSVEMTVSSRRRSAGVGSRQDRAAGGASRSTSGSTGRPAERRISRPSAWNVRIRTVPALNAERLERGVDPLDQLVGGALVEGDRGDPLGGRRRRRRARRSARRGSSSCRCRPARGTGPDPVRAVAAARWSGVSRASRSATAGWKVDRRRGRSRRRCEGDVEPLPGPHFRRPDRATTTRAGALQRLNLPSALAPMGGVASAWLDGSNGSTGWIEHSSNGRCKATRPHMAGS